MQGLVPGDYVLLVEAAGFQPVGQIIEVVGGERQIRRGDNRPLVFCHQRREPHHQPAAMGVVQGQLLLQQVFNAIDQAVGANYISGAPLFAVQRFALRGLQAKADMGRAHIHARDDVTLFLHEAVPRVLPSGSALP